MDISVARVKEGDPAEFEVVLRDGRGESRHLVTMAEKTRERLAPGHTAEDALEAAFRFLLDREPKEAILTRFDIVVIGNYFPEFEKELLRYLR